MYDITIKYGLCLEHDLIMEPETAGFEPTLQLLTQNVEYEAAALPSIATLIKLSIKPSLFSIKHRLHLTTL